MFQFLLFSLSEGTLSLWRSRMLNLLSIGTIMFAMFILGSFIFVALNLRNLTINWQEQIQFNIFLKDAITPAEQQQLQSFLNEHLLVETAVFLSKEDARKKFEKDFEGYAEASAELQENPFPASFQVALLKGIEKDAFQTLRTNLEQFKGIDEIFYDEEIFKRLTFFANLIQMAGWFFGSIMVFSSIFSISNVLKLTFFTRREEVDIMKLVGASRSYIRGPFIVEGVLQGLVGALFGVVLVFMGYVFLTYYLGSSEESIFSNLELVFIPFTWLITLILAGGFSGLLGSLFSLNQFLEEHIRYQ